MSDRKKRLPNSQRRKEPIPFLIYWRGNRKVGINQPRISGWGWSPALVTLPLAGGVTNPRWQGDPAQLLSAIKARNLVAPDTLLQAPPDYRVASSRSMYDEYFVLHAEGLKPKHKVKTGFDFAELREVAPAVSDLLGLELSAGHTPVADIYQQGKCTGLSFL